MQTPVDGFDQTYPAQPFFYEKLLTWIDYCHISHRLKRFSFMVRCYLDAWIEWRNVVRLILAAYANKFRLKAVRTKGI